MIKHPYKIDIPVLLIFFSRSEQFEKVFEQVKLARPSKLYLYQDGPRKNRKGDLEGINKCREIANQIDWECEVYKLYQEENYGCDPSEYIAQKWMFENEEYGIVLEDDDVPAQSFFPFCKELLERYKDNSQINMICGMNHTGVSKHIESDYLFTNSGSIWGWASWKRVIDTWDKNYDWLDDEEKLQKIKTNMGDEKYYNRFIEIATSHRKTGIPHYESIFGAAQFIDGRLNIVPKYNMISNIGVAAETTHSVDNIKKLPRRVQKLLFMKTYEIKFPLIHPSQVVCDRKYDKMLAVNQIQEIFDKIEGTIRRVYYGDIKEVYKSFKRYLKLNK